MHTAALCYVYPLRRKDAIIRNAGGRLLRPRWGTCLAEAGPGVAWVPTSLTCLDYMVDGNGGLRVLGGGVVLGWTGGCTYLELSGGRGLELCCAVLCCAVLLGVGWEVWVGGWMPGLGLLVITYLWRGL